METLIEKPRVVTVDSPDRENIQTGIAKAAGALTFIAGLNGGWLGPLIQPIAKSQNLPLDQVGLIVSLLCGGCFVSQALGPKILALLGGKRALITGASLLATGMLGLAFAKGLIPLLLMAFLAGLGTGINSIAGHVCLLAFFREKGASALSKLNISYGVGALIAPQIVMALAALTYQSIFIISAALSLAVAGFLTTLPQMDREMHINKIEGATTPVKESFLSFFTLPMALMAAVTFLYVGTESSAGTWLFTYMHDARSASDKLASLAVTSLFMGLTLGRLIAIKATVKFKPSKVTLVAMSLVVLAFVGLDLLSATEHLALLLALAIGVGLGPIYPSMVAQTAHLVKDRPERAASVTALAISSGAVGGILMPGITGQVLARIGVEQSMVFITALSLIMLVTFSLALLSIKSQAK
jgi:FHS family glucose/mannose:H+ symporter-like MFS transporter